MDEKRRSFLSPEVHESMGLRYCDPEIDPASEAYAYGYWWRIPISDGTYPSFKDFDNLINGARIIRNGYARFARMRYEDAEGDFAT